jgi:hypothetical protein
MHHAYFPVVAIEDKMNIADVHSALSTSEIYNQHPLLLDGAVIAWL